MTRLAPKPDSASQETVSPALAPDRSPARRPWRSLVIGFGLGAIVAVVAGQVLAGRSPQTTEAASPADVTAAAS